MTYDAVVIGAGFGGLGTALTLAEGGAEVVLCEALKYPGGCASTFSRDGYRFDAGATLLSGLGEAQLFGRWLARYTPGTEIDWLDPAVELRAPGLTLKVRRERGAVEAQLAALPGAPREGLRGFFAEQRAIAEVLWKVLDSPEHLPPFDAASLWHHARRALSYAPLAKLLGRPLERVMRAHRVEGFAPLRLYADAVCQITVQCAASEAEALFAFAALDYCYRGTGHLRGGVGTLADALLSAVSLQRGTVSLANQVRHLRYEPSERLWHVEARRGPLRARAVVANLLPGALASMLTEPAARSRVERRLGGLTAGLDDAWGAAMLYLGVEPPPGAPAHAHHLQLVADPQAPLIEGNHVFASISGADEPQRAPPGQRTVTVSTHVPLKKLPEARAAGDYVRGVQDAMRATLAARAPEWMQGVRHQLPASPRTFARFVGRPGGAVGGLPRRAGLVSYAHPGPREVLPGLWLVGDSVFPGQSALAAAVGGVRTARAVERSL